MRLLHLKLMKFWIVALLFFIPSHSFAQRWRYCLLVAPESYPLRWGEREPPNADMVAMPPGLDTRRTIPTSPGCYKVGKSGFWLSYSVEDAGLVGGLFWDEITGEAVWQRYYYPVWREGVVSLDGLVLPSYITVLGFQVVWLGYGSMFTRFTVFVVLDEPKEPMNPAWVSVLRISCQWARGESTVEGAARKLTEMTHQNTTYDTEALLFCYPPLPDQGEYFYLKLFLNRGMRGQCNEIADFLCCLMTSVGIRASVQRTNRRPFPKEAAFWTNKLLIRELREGELLTYRHHRWHYHQYVLFNCSPQSVYDGTVRFHPTVVHPYYPHQAPDYGYVVGWVRGGVPSDGDWARAETTYRRFLVSPYIPLSDPPQTYTILWEPTPEPSGFIPAVYASDQVTCQR